MDRDIKVSQLSNFILGLRLIDSNRVGMKVEGNMQVTPYMVSGVMLHRGETYDLVSPYVDGRLVDCLYECKELKDLMIDMREDVKERVTLLNTGKLINSPFSIGMEIELLKKYSEEIKCSSGTLTIDILNFMLKPIDEEDLSKGEMMNTILEAKAKDKRVRLFAHEIGEKFQIKDLKNPRDFGNKMIVKMTPMGIIRPIVLHIDNYRFTIDCSGVYVNGRLTGADDNEDVYISGWKDWQDNKNIKKLLQKKNLKKLGTAISLVEKYRRNIAPHWLLQANKIEL